MSCSAVVRHIGGLGIASGIGIFSGVAAAKIAVGTMGVAITNAAADTLARSLALELAPVRGSTPSPRA